MKIEWSSDFHSDGRRRTHPKASTIHGWIVKWRGTFSGNEKTRREGMREMREAKAIRQRRQENKKLDRSTSSASVPPRSKPRSAPVRRNTTGGSGSKGAGRGAVHRAPTGSRPKPPLRRATAPTGSRSTRKPPVRTASTPGPAPRPPGPQSRPSQRRPSTQPRPNKRTA